jgi:nucleoside-diphosphate-sugar epimerase
MNIACGECYTLVDLCHELVTLSGKSVQPIFTPPRVGDVKHSMAAIEKAKQWLGYQPDVKWREGLRRTVEWYLK